MVKSGIWDALKPMAARMPRVVREHEILRVAAWIPSKDAPKTAEIARQEILRWAERRCGGRLPKDAWELKDFEYFSGGRNSGGIRIEREESDIWAIRADDPDKSVAGRIWTTEVVIGLLKDQHPRFSARLLVSTHESELEIEPHTPGFVQQVTESCGLWRGNYEVKSEATLIGSEDEAAELVEMLLDDGRQLPVYVLSVPDVSEDTSKPLIDADSLARATLGLSHVVVLPAEFSWALTQQLGRIRSVFGGAARVYLPGFKADANPYAHRLFLADHINTKDGLAQSIRWMRWLAAAESLRRASLGRDVLSFAAIRSSSLRAKQQKLAREGASESEQLLAARARIEALEKELEDQKINLDYFDSEHRAAEERAEAAEEQMRASAFRIQELLSRVKEDGSADDESEAPPQAWSEFLSWCDVALAGRVALTPVARRMVRAPEFEDVHVAAQALLWLANECRARRLNGGEGSLRDEPVVDGLRNAHCGSDQFDLTWQGQRHTADWHIKNGGNTRDPKRCLRIYYFWDSATQQIVVAEMPAHRKTDAS